MCKTKLLHTQHASARTNLVTLLFGEQYRVVHQIQYCLVQCITVECFAVLLSKYQYFSHALYFSLLQRSAYVSESCLRRIRFTGYYLTSLNLIHRRAMF